MTQVSYSVSEITRHIKSQLEEDPILRDLWIEGEISNWKRSAAGHCYFTLKDVDAAIGAVMWRTTAGRLSFVPQDGQSVLAHGRVSVYEPRGQYQFYADLLQPVGLGSLYLQFEALKRRLDEEGLFAEERKRPLPLLPARIGVVTSATGAARRDIENVLRRRWPVAQVLLAPTLVQGAEAPAQIVAALRALYRREDVDLIIVARGGGSIEDLWAFNDEGLARTVAASRVPVISGVGHAVDFTIVDFVSDVRAPTPSAAAEVAVPDQGEVYGQLSAALTVMAETVRQKVALARREVDAQQRTLTRLSPVVRVARERQQVDDLLRRTQHAWRHRLSMARERLSGLERRLQGLNPQATLDRGYAIVRGQDGGVVRRVSQVKEGERIDVRVTDGGFAARVGAG